MSDSCFSIQKVMAKRSFNCYVEQELGKFPHFLIYAVLEWVLIILLFIDGFIAFAANEFAKFFDLKIPCLLCTRIDHYLVNKNPSCHYNESICATHKKDVSSLAYCHVHKKLSDIRTMCETCLLSFSTQKESGDCDTYKSLVGILRKEMEVLVDDDHDIHLTLPCSEKDQMVHLEKSSVQRCPCCEETLKVKSYSKGKIVGLTSQAPAPSPRAPVIASRTEESRTLELPNIRYTELKFITDNETERQEEEGGTTGLTLSKQFREEMKAAAVTLPTDPEYFNEDKTPSFVRGGNKFFGIPLSDSAQSSPRWSARLLRKSPLEKTDDAEGNVSNEALSDSILQHLNRQVGLDRKSLMALYVELDEERSAAHVAANNAMAMITRLQAEKAAVQMDALQYQRMMEEQAEYDQEALQTTKDLLIKRDEEIKDLEAEIEAYREKYGILRDEEIEGHAVETDDDCREFESKSCSSDNKKTECSSPPDSFNQVSYDGECEKINGQAGSSQEENGVKNDDKLLLSKQMGNLENADRKAHFSLDDGIPSLQSSEQC